ncbi:MAG: hypothetical protein ACOCV1_08245 [Bacillota bacterium]
MKKYGFSKIDFDEEVKRDLNLYEGQFYANKLERVYNCYFKNDSEYAIDYFNRLKSYDLDNKRSAFQVYSKELLPVSRNFKKFEGIKGLSVASSSRLCFDYFSFNNQPFVIRAKSFSKHEYYDINISSRVEFEKILHIKDNHGKTISTPNLDAIFEDQRNRKVFVECKCHELFDSIDEGYKKTIKRKGYIERKNDLLHMLDEIRKILPENSKTVFPYVQFIKHIYGISSDYGYEEKMLLYIYFKPQSKKLDNLYIALENQMKNIVELMSISNQLSNNKINVAFAYVNISDTICD